jgi:glycosyltransferase involved in cell wall biosynthesis
MSRKYSIIVPVFNAEAYLADCLTSVLAQTYENWELILVDDGATDRSPAICADFQTKKAEQITIIHQENQGLLLARRQGLAAATGDYLLALDADDALAPQALAAIDAALEGYEADLLFFNFSFKAGFKKAAMHFPFNNLATFEGEDKAQLYRLLAKTVNFNPIWNKVAKRTLIDLEEDYSHYDRRVQMGEDLLQVLPLLEAAEKILYLAENLYFYRINKASMTKWQVDPAHYESIKIVLERFYAFIDRCQLADGEVLKREKTLLYLNERLSAAARANLSADGERVKSFLCHISQDDFFRDFYQKSKSLDLSLRQRLTLRLLYQGKIDRLIGLYQINQHFHRRS